MRSILRNSFTQKAASAILGAALCLVGSDVFAATITANTGARDWNTTGAWVGGVIPTAIDDVIIPASSTVTIDKNNVGSCHAISIVGSLVLTKQSGIHTAAILNIGDGISTITGTLVTEGVLNLASGGTLTTNKTLQTGLATYNFDPTSTVIFSGTTAYNLPNLVYGNLEILNSGGVNMTTTLQSTNLKGYLSVRNQGKLNNKGFDINLTNPNTFTMDAGTELILEGNTTLSNVAPFSAWKFDPASAVNFNSANTVTNLPGGIYNQLIIGSPKSLAADVTILGKSTIDAAVNLNGKSINVGSNELILTANGSLSGFSASNYIKLGTGKLTIDNIGTTGRTSAITYPIGTTNYTPATITNAGPAQSFSVTVTDGVLTNGLTGTTLTDKVIKKTWNVTKGGTATPNVTLTLQWNAEDVGNNFNPNYCSISHYDGSKWERVNVPTGAASGSGPYTLTRYSIGSLSPFGVGSATSVLPVSLTSFTATKKASEVALAWETASEKNNTGFEVQASADGKNYEAVGFVASQNGNSANTQRYAFSHKTAGKEGLMYYRLKQVDLDGKFEYFTAKVVDLGKFNQTVATFPNPFVNQFELNLTATAAETAQITVTDMAGKTVFSTNEKLQKGSNTLKVTLENQPAGLYLLKATAGAQTYTNRLVKQ